MTFTDQLLERARRRAYEAGGPSSAPPKVAVLACMDARIDVYRLLGLSLGDAHVLRNAGGVVTDDAIRSLVLSQRLFGTREIVLVHHTDCGMTTFHDDALRDEIAREVGFRPPFALEAFADPREDVRQSIARLRACPFLPHRAHVRGFVLDVHSGALEEVVAPGA
ncbi:MAG TPA: carbonic anhydrase [Acidimicrobiales bacterium]|jgi:carbonic anhydrase|nr:carbonic anhydrase [Acidimicrobiales bacterium]